MCQLIPILGVSGGGSSCVSWLAQENVQQPQQLQSEEAALKTYTDRSWLMLLIVPVTAVNRFKSITFPIYITRYFLRLGTWAFSSCTCLLSSPTAPQRSAVRRL